ncbi:Fatty-acid--CoA ligase [Streptomyces graminofaciens]|uniref:Fatty-acid--CoA ligase n=1 Tax=Streptomyces graminofaciens TaxID=68212 RepID=A0ABN5VG05_9ACTN|nr:long-chain fatty acid--CoA ligase [Streptomyces graminofaciens]BBC31923.1 Fatty-acid--CoA ligase [Streptomyces graminofaciens]
MAAVDISPAVALHRRAKYPTPTALVYEGQEFSAADLSRTAVELAAGLAEQGLRRGDRIAYLGFNSAVFLHTLFAAAHLGAVFVPVNFRLAADEVRHILTDSGAHTLVVEEGHRELVESILGEVPARRHLLVDTDPACPAAATAASDVWTPLSRLLGPGRPTREPVPLHDDDLGALMYTSGTTGRPKGVMLTHGNLWWNAVNVDSMVDTRSDDVNLAAAPLFHIGGLNALTLRTLLRGGTVVLRRGFDPAQCLDDLVRYRVNGLFAVPAMFAALARVPGFADADLSALRSAVVAGAPVPPQLIKDYAECGILLQQAWGLTETAPFATYLPAGLTQEKAGSAGAPMPYTEICLTHPGTGARIDEADTRGEICVRGPNVTPGYWNNPEATAAAFDDAGWFHTGDVAHRDKDGFYYIVDRLKDMIISGGENIYPAEVERVLAACPGVLEAAVIGVPDPKWGETVQAVLTCASGTVLTLEDVREFAGRHLARYKLPTRLLLVDQLPRNASGKLAKAELRRMAEAAPATDTV